MPGKDQSRSGARTLSSYLIKVAQLGVNLAHTKPAAGEHRETWQGLSRLTHITLVSMLARAQTDVGNRNTHRMDTSQ